MNLSIDQYDQISEKLRQAQAITLLIANVDDGINSSAQIHTAALLVDDLLSEVHETLNGDSKRKRAA